MKAAAVQGTFARWFNRTGWIKTIISIPYAWLVFFFLLPFVIVMVMSFGMRVTEAPPVGFLPEWPYVTFENYQRLTGEGPYFDRRTDVR